MQITDLSVFFRITIDWILFFYSGYKGSVYGQVLAVTFMLGSIATYGDPFAQAIIRLTTTSFSVYVIIKLINGDIRYGINSRKRTYNRLAESYKAGDYSEEKPSEEAGQRV